MSKKKAVSGLATGAATGAAVGGAVGSIVPVIGTGIGGAVGAIGGGLIGLFAGANADDDQSPQAEQAEDQAADLERQKERAKKDAYQQFMLGEAGRLGANPTLLAKARMDNQVANIDAGYGDKIAAAQEYAQEARDQSSDINPQDLLTLGRTVGNSAQGLSRQLNTPVATPVDIGRSPEVQVAPDPENLTALRRGKLMGFGGQTY